MVHVISTEYGWAVTSHVEGLLAHFEGEHGFYCAEKFAMRWLAGHQEKQPNPLPQELRQYVEENKQPPNIPSAGAARPPPLRQGPVPAPSRSSRIGAHPYQIGTLSKVSQRRMNERSERAGIGLPVPSQ